MRWFRRLFLTLPLLALGLAAWAAWQTQRARQDRGEARVLMLPGGVPALNPYAPAHEAERQLLDLLHEPLIRLNSKGRLAPALAEEWSWHQRLSCVFPGLESLREAQRRLAEVTPETRAGWGLQEVTVDGLRLTLRFARVAAPGAEAALQILGPAEPLPLTLLRLEGAPAALLEDFAAHPDQAGSTLQLWFDDLGGCEWVTTRPLLAAQQALARWLRDRGQPVPAITPLAELRGLLEPVLEFRLSGARARWSDGAPVTADDVRASLAQVRRLGVPVAAGFRDVQAVEPAGPGRVQVVYRRRRGAALSAWVGFPILPAAALKPGAPAGPPPGAGPWRVAARSDRLLSLEPKVPGAGAPLHCLPAASPLLARAGVATGALDLLWPAPGQEAELRLDPRLQFHAAPPRNRLIVLWNTRSPRLASPALREALALAVDRDALISELLGGQGRPAEGLFQPGIWFDPQLPPLRHDPGQAREKLIAAGWLQDVAGLARQGAQPLEFDLLVTAGHAQREQLAQLLAWQWSRLGARVTITRVPPERLVSGHLAPGRFDAVLLGLDYTPDWDPSEFWHSRARGQGLNFAGVADPQLDLLLEALAGEFDPAQVPARARAVELRLRELHAFLPLLGDLQPLALRADRFPELAGADPRQGLTLRGLLRPRIVPPLGLKMLVPDE